MKKFLLVGLGCALAATATAQTEKGARFIGANLGELSYSKGKKSYGNSSFTIALYPSAGVFVADNFLLGATLPLGYSSYKPGNYLSGNYSTRLLQYGISPFARYYIPGTSPHRFFGQLNAGIMGQTVWAPNYSDGSRDNTTNSYLTYGAAVGYNYFLAPGAALEVSAGYSRNDGNLGPAAGALDVRAGFSIFLPSKGTKSAE